MDGTGVIFGQTLFESVYTDELLALELHQANAELGDHPSSAVLQGVPTSAPSGLTVELISAELHWTPTELGAYF